MNAHLMGCASGQALLFEGRPVRDGATTYGEDGRGCVAVLQEPWVIAILGRVLRPDEVVRIGEVDG